MQQVSPRRDVGRVLGGEKKATPSKRELRNRAKASLEREAQILEEVLNHAATGGAVIVPPLKPAIEARLGKTLALSTLYQMLSRHGWRSLHRTRAIRKPIRRHGMHGKKLPERLAEEVAAFASRARSG